MKKVLKTVFLLAVVGGCIGFASCKKKKNCECTVSFTVMGQTFSQSARGEADGSCESIPEIQQIKKEVEESMGEISGASFDISCKEI